jgi:hypothetical protein
MVIVGVTAGSVSAQGPGPYSPDQVYALYLAGVHKALGTPIDGDPPYWVNLSTVGVVIGPKDTSAANNLANFYPSASASLVIDYSRKLDTLYERVINSMAFPESQYAPAYYAARKVLYEVAPNGELKLDNNVVC